MVDDDILIELAEKEIQGFKNKTKGLIEHGFSCTRVQALSIQRMCIIPNNFISLDIKKHTSLARIKQNLMSASAKIYCDMAKVVAKRIINEY